MGTSHRSMLTELELLKESIRATVDSVARFEESAVRRWWIILKPFSDKTPFCRCASFLGRKPPGGILNQPVTPEWPIQHFVFISTSNVRIEDPSSRSLTQCSVEALRDRCIQLSQDLSSSAKIITENHERIVGLGTYPMVSSDPGPQCDQLSIFLKTRGESPNPTPRTTMLTLADELNGVQLRLLFDSFAVLGLQLRFLRTYMERRVSECTRVLLTITTVRN